VWVKGLLFGLTLDGNKVKLSVFNVFMNLKHRNKILFKRFEPFFLFLANFRKANWHINISIEISNRREYFTVS
jgi:hypothetical protein